MAAFTMRTFFLNGRARNFSLRSLAADGCRSNTGNWRLTDCGQFSSVKRQPASVMGCFFNSRHCGSRKIG